MKTTATKRAKVAAAKGLPVSISHPDKVFWPEDGYTKGDLAEFYQSIFSKLEPYVKDRLLTLERCPDGMAGQCFYQKEMPKGMPAKTPTKRIKNEESKRPFTNYVVGGSLETQLALVNLGCIAIHAMGGRAASPRQPDWICFDLDPDSGEFSDAARAALCVKEGLDMLKLESFAKTSGSRGIHVFVPLRIGPDVDVVRSFAQEFAGKLAAAHPKELTTEHSIAAPQQFLSMVDEAARTGISIDREEYLAGVNAVAAPVYGAGRTLVALLWIVGFASSFADEAIERASQQLRTEAEAISRSLGAR